MSIVFVFFVFNVKCLKKSLLKGKLKPKKVVFIVASLGNSRVLLVIN